MSRVAWCGQIFFLFAIFDFYGPKTTLLRSGRVSQSAHPAPPWTPLPYHNVPYCTPKHHATRIGCCTMRVQTLGGVWERLGVFAARYVVWGPSEGRTESEGVRSQVGPQIPPNTPKHPHTLIYASYGVYTWCMRLWDAYGASAGLYMADKYAYVIPTCF